MFIFNEMYMIHHQLMRRLKSINIDSKIVMMSASWDFLLDSVRHSDCITILPSPIKHFYGYEDVVQIQFENPILWQVILTHSKKEHYTRLERYTRDTIVNYFVHQQKAQPINTDE